MQASADQAITISQTAGVAGWVVASLFAVIAYLLNREITRVGEDHKKLETRVEKEESKREADDKANAAALTAQAQAASAAISAMQQHLQQHLDRALDDLRRTSSTSLSDAEEQIDKLRGDVLHRYDQLSDRFTQMREESIRLQGVFSEKFLTRADFIRDSTVLDGKITSTLRAVGKIEGNVDKLLREYTQGE